jgi:AcrR family transcriptional regulator
VDDDTQAPGSVRPGGRTARTRARVLEAVSALLLEEGYEGLTIDAVAARSGVHRATVYRRWQDVGGLLADTVDAAREQPWEPPDTGSLTGDLIEINRQVAAALTARPSIAQALIAASFRSPAAATALRTFWEDRYARAAIVVTRAAAATGTRPASAVTSDAAAGAGPVPAVSSDAAATGACPAPAMNSAAAAAGDRPVSPVTSAAATGACPAPAVSGAAAATGARSAAAGAGAAAGAQAASETGMGAVTEGRAVGAAEARSVIVAACAPLFYELALMRNPPPADIAERYARMAAAQYRAAKAGPTKDGQAG